MENKFIVYYEFKAQPEDKYLNSNSIQCDDVKELISVLSACIDKDAQNVNVFTIQAHAFML